jgi:hypothetical protein
MRRTSRQLTIGVAPPEYATLAAIQLFEVRSQHAIDSPRPLHLIFPLTGLTANTYYFPYER